MAISSRLLRLPRPQTFLYVFPLSTGASLITLSLVLNKMSGIYGILALFTGYHLSPFQLSMYMYSILAFIVTIQLSQYIKTGSAFHCLALAWLYVLDSIINAAYTAAFSATWFLLLSGRKKGPGADTIDNTSGFTDPAHNVSRVEVGHEGVVNTVPASTAAGSSPGSLVMDRQLIDSVGIIAALWTIRLYFCIVMLSWARQVVRQHIAHVAVRTGQYSSGADKATAEDPFAAGRPEGQGWKGRLGRVMVSIGRSYWLAADSGDEEDWAQTVQGRMKSKRAGQAGNNGIMLGKVPSTTQSAAAAAAAAADTRPFERERRRRSGTGPPEPQVQSQGSIGRKEDERGLLQVPSQ